MMKYQAIISQLSKREKADLLTGKDFWTTRNIDRLGIPSAALCDGPHGVRRQVTAPDHLGLNASIPATCFPTASAMACSWNEVLGEQLGEALGEEAAVQKVNVLLGPGVNIKRNPLCGRNFEYFSEDPYLAGKMAASYIRGIQKNGISACVKHFACNNQELRRMVLDSVVDERTLREIYLTAFEIAVKEGRPKSLMTSYNKINGTYASENRHLLSDILRKEWGFDGVVVTDWGGCNDRVEGLKAGNDLDMPGHKRGADAVLDALNDGCISEAEVDECLDRLLDLVFQTNASLPEYGDKFDENVHHALAEKCAEECIVLLKNEGNVLPLSREKVCFIGSFAKTPRFQGAGSSMVNPTKTVSITEEVQKYPISFLGFSEGFDRQGKNNSSLKKEALELAAKSDVVLFFAGLDELRESEGVDRSDMKLPANQLDLFQALQKTGKKIIVILFSGSPVELGPLKEADGILQMYLSGQGCSAALLKILCGQVNPSGKLAESWPEHYEDCSTSELFHAGDFIAEYREGPFIGYRYYQTAKVPVPFPFGFGLSYTTFSYCDLTVDADGVTFTVTNTGTRAGAETVQLYVSCPSSNLIRPMKELKGFRKVFLKPGASRRVQIPFDAYTFRFYNVQQNCWQTEAGTYQILVGSSSEDIRLTADIVRDGVAVPFNRSISEKYRTADIKAISLEEFETLLGRKPPSDRSISEKYQTANVKAISSEESETLLGRNPSSGDYTFLSDQRHIQISDNQTISDLKYAKGWAGWIFAGGIHLAHKVLVKIGKTTTANTLEMGMFHLPMRALAQFTGMNQPQYEGMLLIFNGHTFQGLRKILRKP